MADANRMVHILATGVFFTGFIKDMLSLPRPLSPPLHRITMSGSAALEYGFPSTHSANAVSVVVYTLFTLYSPECTLQPNTKLALEFISYCYAFSITLGRLYCGMHGFFDVIIGSILGALLSAIECVYGPLLDNYLYQSSWRAPLAVAIIIIILIRIHPEPADNCPCFDDSVAFAGVMIGVELGGWHYAAGDWAWDHPVPATVPFDLERLGWPKALIRIFIGVLIIFAWREVMKPTLLKFLPHLFRIIERLGLSLPRKFFMPASEYKKIPSRLKFDNIMPSVSDLPSLLTSIRHPGRGRSVSVGPQSAADAYETLAYRDKRRRESMTSNDSMPPTQMDSDTQGNYAYQPVANGATEGASHSRVSAVSPMIQMNGTSTSKAGCYEQLMGQGSITYLPATSCSTGCSGDDVGITVKLENELGEREMFSRLEKPRVRYDVEVITKLVVYTGVYLYSAHFHECSFSLGIAWLAVEINPIIFEIIGLGMGPRNH
jgi:dihydrosphingosine 1-phosphate phosphatase